MLPIDNRGCPACKYGDISAGPILSLEEMAGLPMDDEANRFNDVSPAFIAAVLKAGQHTSGPQSQAAGGSARALALAGLISETPEAEWATDKLVAFLAPASAEAKALVRLTEESFPSLRLRQALRVLGADKVRQLWPDAPDELFLQGKAAVGTIGAGANSHG